MDDQQRDAFVEAILLMCIYGANSGPADMPIWEWRLEQGDTCESLEQSAEKLAGEVEAWLGNAAESAMVTDRIAIQIVRMRKGKTLTYVFIRSTFGEWDEREELVTALNDLKPQLHAPLVYIKILTEPMMRNLSSDKSKVWNTGTDLSCEETPESDEKPTLSPSLAVRAYQTNPIGARAWFAAARVGAGEARWKVRHQFLQMLAVNKLDATSALNLLDAFLGSPTWLAVARKQ